MVKKLKDQFTLLLFASSPFAQGEAHDYESAKRIRDELDGIITRMSPHAASTTITLANRIWPDDKGEIRKFVTQWDYVGMQAPLADVAKTGIQLTEIRHLGIPPELSKRITV